MTESNETTKRDSVQVAVTVRKEVAALALAIEHELQENDHKEHWSNFSPNHMVKLLKLELLEAYEEYRNLSMCSRVNGCKWCTVKDDCFKENTTAQGVAYLPKPEVLALLKSELADSGACLMMLFDHFNYDELDQQNSVKSIPQIDLIKRAILNTQKDLRLDQPLWIAAKNTFQVGSTYARELCKLCGLDPDSKKPDRRRKENDNS